MLGIELRALQEEPDLLTPEPSLWTPYSLKHFLKLKQLLRSCKGGELKFLGIFPEVYLTRDHSEDYKQKYNAPKADDE